jgi:hypothetical protein
MPESSESEHTCCRRTQVARQQIHTVALASAGARNQSYEEGTVGMGCAAMLLICRLDFVRDT